jgi:hypothetical protein
LINIYELLESRFSKKNPKLIEFSDGSRKVKPFSFSKTEVNLKNKSIFNVGKGRV